MAAIIRDDAEPLPPPVPAPLRWVVERCLAKDAAERYDSTRDLYRELKHARERLSEASASSPVQPAIRHPKWHVWGSAIVVALAIAAITLVAARLAWRTPEPPLWSGIVLGGDERLVLENAFSPEPLPDGSLLIVKLNAEGRFQLHRFWPGSGRIQALPIRMSQSFYSAHVRAFPDGKTAVVWGEPIGQTASSPARNSRG
jgi:hypothetical protein